MSLLKLPRNLPDDIETRKFFENVTNGANKSSYPIRTIYSDYSLLPSDATILADCSSAAISITLPFASRSKGRVFDIKKIDSSANSVTITPQTSELIDGSVSIAFSTQYQSYTIQSSGEGWYIL